MDKMYLMLPEFKTITDWKGLEAKILEDEGFRKWGKDNVRMTLDMIKNGMEFSEGTPEMHIHDYYVNHSREFTTITKVKYDHSKPIQDNSRQQRNNLIIDIARSILTNADTVDKFVSPGSFDKLRRISRICEILDNRGMLEKAIALTKQSDVPLIGEDAAGNMTVNMDIFGLTDDELEDITSSTERDPLSPRTFFYYHKQNMAGGALIGMYANNTTLFAKFQSRDQKVPRMVLKHAFTVNGHTYNRLDGIYSPNGDIISKNCAEFSAASVDNVKDQVLAKLMQNPDTADLTALMLRVGMSIDEIGLLFTQPIIEDWINFGMPGIKNTKFRTVLTPLINDDTKAAIASFENGLNDGTSEVFKDIPLTDLVLGKILINNINYYADLSPHQINYLNISQAKILYLMAKLHEYSGQLSQVTKVSRADSPNGAMATSIAGNIIQKQRVDRLRTASKQKEWVLNGTEDIYNPIVTADMTRDELRSSIMNSRFPMLQAFYSLGIEFGGSLMKEYFVQYNDVVTDIVNELSLQGKHDTLDEKQLNNFFRSFIKYQLSDLKIFKGKDFNETRDFYLSQFPNRFMRFKHSHPEYANIGILKKISQDSSGNLQFKRSARLTPAMRDSFMRDLNSLLYRDDIDIARQLAMDLFAYAYFKDGFFFGPNSYGTFFSTQFITQIPEFIEGLRAMISYNDTQDAHNFLGQFLVNNLRSGILKEVSEGTSDVTGGKIAREPFMDPRTKEYTIVVRTKYFSNSKDIDGRGYWRARKYFVYNQKDEYGSEHAFLAELIDTNKDYTTYRLVPEADARLSVRQSDGVGKVVFVGARYNKSMDYHKLAKYRVSNEAMSAYYLADEDNPDYIMDTTPDNEAEQSEPQELPKYTADTNNNKEDFCK